MKEIVPKFNNDGFMIVEDVFWERYLTYAKTHRFNVIYTETHSCDFVECLKAFKEAGYKDTIIEVPCRVEGLELKPELHCKFELIENSH